MHHRTRRSQTPTIAVGNCNSELVESSSVAHHRSVCAAAVGAIKDGSGRGCRDRCAIGLKNPIMSAVVGCNSELVESSSVAHHRSVCAAAFWNYQGW